MLDGPSASAAPSAPTAGARTRARRRRARRAAAAARGAPLRPARGARDRARRAAPAPPTVVDGGADGARRAGRARRAARAARRSSTPAIARRRSCAPTLAAGGEVVVTDSNRRRVFVASRLRQNTRRDARAPATRSPRTRPCSTRSPSRGTDAQTVAVYGGVALAARAVLAGLPAVPRAPAVRRVRRRPGDGLARRPQPRRPRRRARRRVRRRPRDVPYVDLLPYSDPRGTVTAVEVAGHTLRRARRLEPPAGPAARRALAAPADRGRAPARHASGGAGGISEVRIPGVHVTEALRAAGGGRARAGGPRPPARRPHLPLPAHDRRRPVPPRAVRGTRPGRRWSRDRGDGERGLARVCLAARRALVASGRLVARSRRPRPTPSSTRSPARTATRRFDSLGALRGATGVPRLARVRRRPAARLGRRVGPRPPGVAGVDRAARRDRCGA